MGQDGVVNEVLVHITVGIRVLWSFEERQPKNLKMKIEPLKAKRLRYGLDLAIFKLTFPRTLKPYLDSVRRVTPFSAWLMSTHL